MWNRVVGLGVIWKGDKLIDGVPETLDMLRSMVSTQVLILKAR